MTPTNSWQAQCDARQKLLEPLIQRAIDRVRSAVAPRIPKVTNSIFYGAIGIDPKHLVIWFIFAKGAEKKAAEASGFAKELDRVSRDALRVEGYPEVAIGLMQVGFASDEEIERAGGWNFFR